MRFGSLAASGMLCVAVSPLSGCTRTLDFDALAVDDDEGVVPPPAPETALPGAGIDAGSPCRALTPALAFCDDFDDRGLDVWSEVLATPADGGTVAHDSADSLSPPRSLAVTVAAGIPTGTYVSMGLHRALAESAAPRRIAIEFDLKVEQLDPKPGRDIVAFQLLLGERNGIRNQLVLAVQSAGGEAMRARFNENLLAADGSSLAATPHTRNAEPALGRWQHVSFTLDVRTPAGGKDEITLRIGPSEIFPSGATTLVEGPLEHALRPGQPLMEVGVPWLSTAEPTAAWRLRYDNVMVRIRE